VFPSHLTSFFLSALSLGFCVPTSIFLSVRAFVEVVYFLVFPPAFSHDMVGPFLYCSRFFFCFLPVHTLSCFSDDLFFFATPFFQRFAHSFNDPLLIVQPRVTLPRILAHVSEFPWLCPRRAGVSSTPSFLVGTLFCYAGFGPPHWSLEKRLSAPTSSFCRSRLRRSIGGVTTGPFFPPSLLCTTITVGALKLAPVSEKGLLFPPSKIPRLRQRCSQKYLPSPFPWLN